MRAVILCGGKGERLRPITEDIPKSLVPVNGHPILFYLLSYLAQSGIKDFLLCVGYKSEMITHFIGEHARPDWNVQCVDSGDDASMCDRVLDALPDLQEPVLICYGDTIADVDFKALLAQHREAGAAATVTVHQMQCPFGIVEFDARRTVTGIIEKPLLPHWINIGYLLCEPAALAVMRRDSDLVAFCGALTAARVLAVHQHFGRHVTVNTEQELRAAEALLTSAEGLINLCN